jgi:osmoprotectant transport system ATP-binding protein
VIAFHDVWCRRGAQDVLAGVTLDVAPGETLALVGRSGAGKSTILKLINRLLEPARGRIVVDGRDTQAWDPIALRRHTGYVLQDVGLFPHLTISRNVAVVPELLGWPERRVSDRVGELLDLVGLPAAQFGERFPDQLSGGQRQRVGVARALAADPPIVLMDEPFGALDPVTRAELHREFERIQQQVRKTVVLVTHDMREAFVMASRVGVLEAGKLAALEQPAALRTSTHPAVRLLLDAAFEPAVAADRHTAPS